MPPSPKYAVVSKATLICLMASLILVTMFPVCPIWFQHPILKMCSANLVDSWPCSEQWHTLSAKANKSYLTHWPLWDVAVISKAQFSNPLYRDSGLGTCCEIAVRWMSQNLSNGKSMKMWLVHVWWKIANFRQPHFRYQCWCFFTILLPNLVSLILATNVGLVHDRGLR